MVDTLVFAQDSFRNLVRQTKIKGEEQVYETAVSNGSKVPENR